jgi:hypothetical protein
VQKESDGHYIAPNRGDGWEAQETLRSISKCNVRTETSMVCVAHCKTKTYNNLKERKARRM